MAARSRRLAVVADRRERPLRVAEGDAVTLLERLRVVAASLRDFDHADDHMEVDTRDVSALLTEAADAIEATTKERDAARAEVERLLRLASGPHINEVE